MSVSVDEGKSGSRRLTKLKSSEIIDCDIHEPCADLRLLLPYLPKKWHRFITDYKWDGKIQPLSHVLTHRVRGTWGDTSDLPAMQRNVFDAEGVDIGILNGDPTLQWSALSGWYDLTTACASAYNDWQIAEWLDKEPRLRGAVHVVAHDPAAAAREIDRVAAHPAIVQVFLPVVVDRLYGDPMYRPIFEAAVRNGLVVTLHHGAATRTAVGYATYHVEWHVGIPQAIMSQLTSLLCNGVFDAYPDLKVVVLEGGFTWVPHFMKRMDQHYRELRNEIPWVKRMPSDHFRNQIRVATQPMEEMTKSEFQCFLDLMGSEELLLFATDYPHWDADEPSRVLPAGVSDELTRLVMSGNARKTYPRLARS